MKGEIISSFIQFFIYAVLSTNPSLLSKEERQYKDLGGGIHCIYQKYNNSGTIYECVS